MFHVKHGKIGSKILLMFHMKHFKGTQTPK